MNLLPREPRVTGSIFKRRIKLIQSSHLAHASMLTPCVHQKAEVLSSWDGFSVSASPDGPQGGEREGKENAGRGGWMGSFEVSHIADSNTLVFIRSLIQS